MKDYKTKKIQTVISNIHLKGVPEFIEFAKLVLNAEILSRTLNNEGDIFCAIIKLGDTSIFIHEIEESVKKFPSSQYYHVSNVEDYYIRAIEAGAKSLSVPKTYSYGEASAGVVDKWGNQWWFASNREEITDANIEIKRRETC